jgi:glycosyltransferase involved in cell wall biosynthesis
MRSNSSLQDSNLPDDHIDRLSETPLISIIMPAYNAAHYIEEAIRSIQRQTYSNWELIVINDKSTDNTVGLLQSLIATTEETRIRILNTVGLRKPSAVRNVGISEAQGELLAFLDADDAYYPHTLDSMFQHFKENPQLNLCFGFPEYINEHSNHIEYSSYLAKTHQGFDFAKHFSFGWESIFLCNTTLTVSAMLVRASAIQPFKEDMLFSEDYKFYVDIFRLGLDKVKVIADCVYQYRRYQGSVTSGIDRKRLEKVLEDQLYLMDWLYSLPEAKPSLQVLRPATYVTMYDSLAKTLIKQGRTGLARELMLQLCANPYVSLPLWLRSFSKLFVVSLLPGTLFKRLLAMKRASRQSTVGNVAGSQPLGAC